MADGRRNSLNDKDNLTSEISNEDNSSSSSQAEGADLSAIEPIGGQGHREEKEHPSENVSGRNRGEPSSQRLKEDTSPRTSMDTNLSLQNETNQFGSRVTAAKQLANEIAMLDFAISQIGHKPEDYRGDNNIAQEYSENEKRYSQKRAASLKKSQAMQAALASELNEISKLRNKVELGWAKEIKNATKPQADILKNKHAKFFVPLDDSIQQMLDLLDKPKKLQLIEKIENLNQKIAMLNREQLFENKFAVLTDVILLMVEKRNLELELAKFKAKTQPALLREIVVEQSKIYEIQAKLKTLSTSFARGTYNNFAQLDAIINDYFKPKKEQIKIAAVQPLFAKQYKAVEKEIAMDRKMIEKDAHNIKFKLHKVSSKAPVADQVKAQLAAINEYCSEQIDELVLLRETTKGKEYQRVSQLLAAYENMQAIIKARFVTGRDERGAITNISIAINDENLNALKNLSKSKELDLLPSKVKDTLGAAVKSMENNLYPKAKGLFHRFFKSEKKPSVEAVAPPRRKTTTTR